MLGIFGKFSSYTCERKGSDKALSKRMLNDMEINTYSNCNTAGQRNLNMTYRTYHSNGWLTHHHWKFVYAEEISSIIHIHSDTPLLKIPTPSFQYSRGSYDDDNSLFSLRLELFLRYSMYCTRRRSEDIAWSSQGYSFLRSRIHIFSMSLPLLAQRLSAKSCNRI